MGNHRFLPSNLKPMAWIYRLREMGRAKTRPKKMNKQPEANSIAEPPSPAAPQRRRPTVRLSTSGEDAPTIPAADDGKFLDSEDGSPLSFPAEPPRKSCRAPPLRVRTPCRCSCHSITNDESSFPGRFRRKHLRPTPAEPVGRGKQTSAAAASCGGGRATEGVGAPRRSTKGPGVRVKMRLSSPRIRTGRRSVESVAIAKASRDPQRDFRESMVAMVVEYGIREAGELEDLLAGYLSLNSDEYHGLIVSVFQEIWFLLNHSPPPAT